MGTAILRMNNTEESTGVLNSSLLTTGGHQSGYAGNDARVTFDASTVVPTSDDGRVNTIGERFYRRTS